jgi:hypothetical protein
MDTLDTMSKNKRQSISRKHSSQQLSAPTRRSSVAIGFGRNTALDEFASDVPVIPCELKARPSSSLPPNNSKIVSYAPINHPRFRSDCFFSASKTNEVALLVMLSGAALAAAGDDVSDSASVATDADEKSHNRLCLSQVININTMLAFYLKNLKQPVALPIVGHACDSALKVYNVYTHSLKPTLLLLATSLGVLLLDYASAHSVGPYTSSHPSWGNCFVKFNASTCSLCMVRTDISPSQVSASGKRLSTTPLLSTNLQEVANCNISGSGSDLTGGPSMSSHSQDGAGGGAGSLLSSPIRPRFLPSPSGRYLAIVWTELAQYRIFSVVCGRANIDREQLGEIEAGACISFAWIGWTATEDEYAILSPAKRGESAVAKRRRSIFGGKEEDNSAAAAVYAPPAVQFKKLTTDETIHRPQVELLDADFPAESGLSEAQGLFGGPLLLVVHPLKAFSTKVYLCRIAN